MSLKDKITVLIGGKPPKDLPVEIGQDGVIAKRPSQAELPGGEFRRQLVELNKREAEFKAVKEKAERMIQLAGTKEARERAELDGKDQQKIIAGFREEVKTANRASQLLKDDRFNLFLSERERIRASRHAVWVKVYADMIKSLNVQIADAVASERTVQDLSITCLSEHSEVYKEMTGIDTEIDSFNEIVKENRMAGNLFIPNTEKLVGPYEAEAGKAIFGVKRRYEAVIKKVTSVFEAKASEASARAKKLERSKQGPGWIPGKS